MRPRSFCTSVVGGGQMARGRQACARLVRAQAEVVMNGGGGETRDGGGGGDETRENGGGGETRDEVALVLYVVGGGVMTRGR